MDQNPKILVVDGSRVSRRIISKALLAEMDADEGDVASAGTAKEALARLATTRFDLITSSLLLPDMHGLEFCRSVRRSSAHRFTPFIVVTAEPHRTLALQGYSAGVTDYYDKTRGFKDFVSFIHGFAERNAGLAGKVLYVEDDPIEARITSAILADHGLEIKRVTSAERALEMLDQSFDLVLLDFYLEGPMSGGDFVHSVRCGLRYSREELPILVATGGEDPYMQAEMFHAGSNDFVTKPIVEEVLVSRIRSLLLIKQQFKLLKQQSEEMRHLATIDSLTGVYNKRYLMENVGAIFRDPANYPVSLALIDLDHFKLVNDRYGHLAGDRVLAAIGGLVDSVCKSEDAFVCRFGGEEFLIVCRRARQGQCGRQLTDLCRRIAALQPAGITVTASIGLAFSGGEPGQDFDEVLQAADKALYRAKDEGRNRVIVAQRETPVSGVH